MDTLIMQTMRLEQQAAGAFLSRVEFHNGLQYEVTLPDSAPYPMLNAEFDKLAGHAKYCTAERKFLQTKRHELDSIYRQYKSDEVIYALINNEERISQTFTARHAQEALVAAHRYDSLCTSHSVFRRSPQDIAQQLYARQVQCEDSLMLQGKFIAQLKRELDAHIADKRSAEYRKYYNPISELERLHKDYQQLLTQLQNTQARFESMNPEVMYYEGPHIGRKPEVASAENLLGSLALSMGQFRTQWNACPRVNQ